MGASTASWSGCPRDDRSSPRIIDEVEVASTTGAMVPLRQLAHLGFTSAPTVIEHRDRQRAVTVTSWVRTGFNTDRVTKRCWHGWIPSSFRPGTASSSPPARSRAARRFRRDRLGGDHCHVRDPCDPRARIPGASGRRWWSSVIPLGLVGHRGAPAERQHAQLHGDDRVRRARGNQRSRRRFCSWISRTSCGVTATH